MTRLWIFSDLHQEWAVNAYDPAAHAPEAFDVVVVAGDVDTPGDRAIDRLADWFPGTPVVYTPGNHDFYVPDGADAFTLREMTERMRDRAAARGVRFLDDSETVIDDVRFLGGTLWTDQRLGTNGTGHAYGSSRRGMNDYRNIRRGTGRHRHLRVEDTVSLNRATTAYLDATMAIPFDGPTVVVTHHAPSARSLDNPYMDLRWCYASAHDDLVERSAPDLWVHGHLHNAVVYRIGSTRVLSNPRGHGAEQADFVPDLVVMVATGTDWIMQENYRLHDEIES